MSNHPPPPRLGVPFRHRRAQEAAIPPRRRTPVCRRLTRAWAFAAQGLLLAASAVAQERPPVPPCADGRITSVFVDNHSIFDLDELGGGPAMRGLYRLANALHVKTREQFIRGELLFREGDCHDPFLLEESGRILRAYAFIARADVFSVRQPDGSHHVVVDTQDEWTTRMNLGVSFEDGLQLESVDLSELNLGGVGIHAGVFLRQRKERKDLGARVFFPRILGTRTDAGLSAGRTRAGTFVSEQLAYPFVGEVGRFAVRQTFHRRDELFPYVASDPGADYSHLLLPFVDERVELSMAGRLGEPGSLTLLGFGLSRETLRFDDFPGSLEIARDNDFGNAEPAPAGSESLVAGQAHAASTTRLNLFVGQRNVRFARVRGLDPLAGVQDIQLGTDVGLTLGRSLGALSVGGLPSADDLYGRLSFFAGHDPGTSYLFFAAGVEGRQVFSRGAGGDGWRDVLGEADLYGYLRSRKTPGHTFFARISAAGGWSMDSPFQLSLGGRSAVRGLDEEDFPGGRRILLTLEDRFFVRWPAPDLLDLGFTLFADAGRVWAGQVPFGTDSGWKGAVGGGIRFGFPAGTRGVVRMDLAFPLGMDGGRGPVFRVTLYELLGLLTGFQDPDMARSRRITVGPDFFTTSRR